MRFMLLLLTLACAWISEAAGPRPAVVEAVEFPYYLYPQQFWARELVWLKAIGIRTVEFSIPWNWHELQPGEYDFTGRTSPRRDLVGLIRLLRRLELHAWIRPLPPVPDWPRGGAPETADPALRRAWLRELERLLATQGVRHGGPIEFVEGGVLGIGAGAPPAGVVIIPASSPTALALARSTLALGRGALLWTGVEDALYPEGWSPNAGPMVRHGIVTFNGSELPATGALRRNAALLRRWSGLLPSLRPSEQPKRLAGKFPEGVTVAEVTSPAASAIMVTNLGRQIFHDDLRVLDPVRKHPMVIPAVTVRPGDSLWLPLSVSLGPDGLCRECSNFSGAERIVYATAELTGIEFENGILAMEFSAPESGEVVLQLARKPIGPYLAAGKPMDFDWDDRTLRARLRVPASQEPGNAVRIGIAIEEPETSAFFNDARRLIIGQTNLLSTVYSSAEVASRSRLLLPQRFTSSTTVKSPNEIDYQVTVPADELHGDFANLALEADGMPLGRARVQLLRPLSVRLVNAIELHFGPNTTLAPEPQAAVVDPKAGTNVEIALRNHTPAIQTYSLQPMGEGLEFLPPKAEVSIGAASERRVAFRVFGRDPGTSGVRDWQLHVRGGAELDLPMRVILAPRGQTTVWTADLDSDGTAEWVLESARIRAVFTPQDGGRWMEFTWKETDTNLLPEGGAFASPGRVEIRAAAGALEFLAPGWKRTVTLSGTFLSVTQTTPLPPDGLAAGKTGSVTLDIERPAQTRVTYSLH
jgi:hypothetical protein